MKDEIVAVFDLAEEQPVLTAGLFALQWQTNSISRPTPNMNEQTPPAEYLVLSRGQWDKDASKEDIEAAIHEFYDWLARTLRRGG